MQITTCLHFVEFYTSVGIVLETEVQNVRTVRIIREYCELLVELCLAEYSFCRFLPEQLAIACIAAARKIVGISH